MHAAWSPARCFDHQREQSCGYPVPMSVLRYLRWVLSTGDLPEWDEQSEQKLLTVMPQNLESCGLVTFLVKPLILRWLGHSHDGSVTPSTADLVRSATHHTS